MPVYYVRKIMFYGAIDMTAQTTRAKISIGYRIGHLRVEEATSQHKNGYTIWRCRCDCGGEIDAPLHQLTAGYRKSCGCLSHPPLKDYLGKRFSMLTVTGYAGKEDGQHLWRCKCDCGKETVVRQTNLQSGKTKSCGCLQEKQLLENLKLCRGYVRYHSGSWQTALAPHQHQRRDRRLPEQAHRKMVRADHVQTKNVLSRCV